MRLAARQLVETLDHAAIKCVTDFRQKGPNPRGHTRSVGVIIRQVRKNTPCSALFVFSPEDYPSHAVKQKRAHTHQTWLKRRIAGHLATARP